MPSRVHVARTPRKEKQIKWRRKLPSLEMNNSVSVIGVTLKFEASPWGNFLDSDSENEDHTSDSGDGSENILQKSCVEDASDMSDEDFPVRRMKRFAGKKGVELRKNS